jgi:hypothetical protein
MDYKDILVRQEQLADQRRQIERDNQVRELRRARPRRRIASRALAGLGGLMIGLGTRLQPKVARREEAEAAPTTMQPEMR